MNSISVFGCLICASLAGDRPRGYSGHRTEGDGHVLALRAIVIHGIDDLWVAPDPALSDWRSILGDYGQAFDGYRYAKVALGRECSAVAEEVWRRFEARGPFASSFAELRCALFWLQRCVHNNEQSPGWRPSEELESRVHRLYRAIQEAWRRERGTA